VRAGKENELRAELEQQVQRDEARRRLNDLQLAAAPARRLTSGQRRAELQSSS